MITPYYPYFGNQAGLFQHGKGLPVYSGKVIQRGAGIGDFFRSVFRIFTPFIKPAASAIGKEALRAGTSIASDVLDGASFKQSAKTRFKEAGKNLLNQVVQRGQGRKRKSKSKRRIRKVKRRRITPDIFDG